MGNSREEIEYPGLYFFMVLLAATVFCLSCFPINSKGVGALLILWGFFVLMRVLWLIEAVFFTRRQRNPGTENKPRGFLSRTILSAMEKQKKTSRGFMVMRTLNSSTSLWFFLGTLYIAWAFYVTVHPVFVHEYQALKEAIELFLDRRIHSISEAQFSMAGKLVIVGFAFWLVQTYSYSRRSADAILWLSLIAFAFLFLVSLLFYPPSHFGLIIGADLWAGYGWERTTLLQQMEILPPGSLSALDRRFGETGIIGVIFLYGGGLLAALIFLQYFFRSKGQQVHSLLGVGILLVLLFYDAFFPYRPQSSGLWLAGWSAISVLWARTITSGMKQYRVRQP